MLDALILAWSPSAPPARWAAPTASALPTAPPRANGTRRGYMARVSQAPGFILTAPAAVAKRAAMAVRAAVAQRERRGRRR